MPHLELIVTTAVTGTVTAAVGWVVKAAFDLLKAYISEGRKWRESVTKSISDLREDVTAVKDATQTNMRTDLCHLYEKYMTRGWLTPEEHSAWHAMHEKYSALDANGLIDTYAERIDQLPHRDI